jgi:tetratricopeptide (TPR) repeat protein
MILDGARGAFAAFGFGAALRLAQGLLGRAPACPAALATEAHALAGLAAHYAQSPRNPSLALAQLEEEHLDAALATEAWPLRRATYLYHLSLGAAKQKRDLGQALSLADRAVDELAHAGPPLSQTGFFAAWARNARAYALFRSGRLEEAVADCEAGLAALASVTSADLPPPSLRLTRWYLTDNLARLTHTMGDASGATAWLEARLACEADMDPLARPFDAWAGERLAGGDLRGDIARHEEALERARRELEPWPEAMSAHILGTLYDRRGDARAALDHFSEALRIWRMAGGFPEDVFAAELNCAVSAYRAGSFDRAEALFARLLADPLAEDRALQAELRAALAMVLAARGDDAGARQRMSEARRLVDESEDACASLRVSRSAGETLLLLRDRDAARAAFARALSEAEGDAEGALAFPPEDRLGVIVGLFACGVVDPALARTALTIAPAALHDANAWWDLPRLVGALAHVTGSLRERDEQHAADAILAAARQRVDCAVEPVAARFHG